MLGQIIEKPVGKISPMMAPSMGGFPAMTRKLTIKSTSAVHSELYDFVCSKSSYQEVTDRTSDEEVSNEIQSGNTTTVLAMSEQERESALQEIQSFLSPKSIEFLQRRTSGSLPKSTEFNEVCDKVQSSGQNSSQEFADAPSSEWLQQQMQATEKRPALDQHIPATMHSERFDLNGRRIVDFEGETILEEKYISASGLFTVQLESSPDLVRSIAAIICSVVREAVIPMSDVAHGNPFYVPQDVAMASAQHQPQDELKHHQYEQGASGYNMLEISEMFRSEYAHQRLLATRMLSGILLRRDCVVALEAYSQEGLDGAFSVNDELGHPCPLFSNLSTCFETALTRFLCHIDVGTVGSQFVFHEHPHNGVSESLSLAAVKPLRKLLTWCFLHLLVASDLPVELPTLFLWALSTSSSSSSSSFANSSENTDGVDNTSLELPMSFGYAAPRNNPAVAKISLLRCLHLYLGSPVEEACANLLQHRGVLWSSYGCPRMPTPHTRRTDRCYEQHMYDCAARAEEFLREEEENDEDGVAPGGQHKGRTPESVREAFALQCRWSRISAVVSRGNLVLLLASHVECAVDAALALVPATAATRNQSSGSHCILQSLGTLSLDLLLTMVRQGDEDVLAVVHRAFLLRTWRLFVSLVDASGGSSSALADEPQPGGAVAAVLRRQWLRVLAVMVRRSRATANFFFQANGEWSSSALLLVIVRRLQYVPDCGSINTCRFTVGHTDDDAVDDEEVCLALRLLSAGLVYGWGLRSVAELLLADQVAVAAVCKGKDKGPSEAGRSLCRDGGAPLFTLLEQAAIACSNILSSGHSGGEVSSQEEATQTSSCLLAFVRGNWAWMENKMLTGVSYPLRSAILAFLCAVFPNTTTTSSTFAPGNNKLPETSHKVAMAEMASEITAVDLASVRGRGTLSSVWDYTEQLVRTAEQHQGGVGSVTATALHLRGQSQELLHFAASQTSFDLRVLGAHIQVLALARAGTGAGVRERATCGRMERCELAFQLQRFVCAVAHVQMQQQTGPSNTDSSIRLISDCSELMNACCAIMETPFRLHLPKTSTSPALEVPPAVAPDLERGAVSAGLLMWHVQRIQQAGLVLLARFAASAFHLLGQDSSNSITTTAAQSVGDALVCLLSTHLVSVNAHSLSGALEVLFGAFLTYNLRICSADDQGGAVEVVAPVALSADIFLKVLGVPLQHATSSSSSAASSSSSALTGRFPLKSATEWLDLRSSVKATETGEGKASESAAAEAKVLSLQPGWAFRVLGGDLADSSFAAWLRVLDSLSSSRSAAAAAPSQDSNNQYLAEQLYHLMKLSTSDQAHKWFKTAAVGGYSDSVEFGYHLPGCHPSAVSAYRRLICRILLQAVGRSHTSFAVEFCSVVSKDFYNTTGLVSKFLKKGKASSSWRESLDGLLDLCDKAVDAALNQAVDPEVHSIVLTVLASPCVPWAVRQRVWSALSAVRLVHLLEDQECIQGLLPTLLLRPQQVIPRGVQSGRSAMCAESLALYTEVIDALTQLRATSDRTWSIVAVSVFQMARYLFVDAQEGSEDIKAVVTGQAAHLLAGLVKVAASKQVQGCWLLQAVLDMAAKVPQHAPATAAVVGAASDECSGVLEDLLATCAQSSTCNSISNVLIPERLCQLAVEYPSAVGNCTLAQIFLLLQ